MTRSSEAAVPDTIEGLRRQNSAYRSLCASLEAQQAIQTEHGRKYQEAISTLDSERQANAILTKEAERLYDVLDRLAYDLMEERDLPPEHQFSPLGSALAALHDLRQYATQHCVCAEAYARPAA